MSIVKSFSMTVGVRPTARFTVSPSAATPVSATGSTSQLFSVDASTTTGTISSYVWNWGNGATPTITTGVTSSHTYPSAGVYVVTLTVTDTTGLTGTASFPIDVYGLPVAVASASSSSGSAPFLVVFDGTQSHVDRGTIAEYLWDFGEGDGFVEGPAIVSHTYLTVGSFNPKLKVVDSRGNTSGEVEP